MGRKILLVLLIAVIGLQFFRGQPPAVTRENPSDLLTVSQVPDDIAIILKQACYDCHSNETIYPWYSYITPVSWFVFDHVRVGREELNFSLWGEMEKRRKIRKLKDIAELVENGEMPLESYTMMHGDAQLTAAQVSQIVEWTDKFARQVISE